MWVEITIRVVRRLVEALNPIRGRMKNDIASLRNSAVRGRPQLQPRLS